MSRFLNLPTEYNNLSSPGEDGVLSKESSTPKRKNDENMENAPPSVSNIICSPPIKKPKVIPSASKPISSALPRFQSTRLKTVAEQKALLASQVTTQSTQKSPIKNALSNIVHRGATAFISGIAGIVKSPPPSAKKAPSKTFATSTPMKEMEDLSKSVAEIQGSASIITIKSLFENGFTIDDEKITNIVANLRCKSKWDNKEKMTKQAAVITDLRAAIKTTFDEVRGLKEQAVSVEANLTATVQRVVTEYAMSRQQVSMLGKEDVRLKAEIKELAATIKSFQNERGDLLQKIFESESRNVRLADDMVSLESRRQDRERDLERLYEESSRARIDSQEALSALKEQYEQVFTSTLIAQLLHKGSSLLFFIAFDRGSNRLYAVTRTKWLHYVPNWVGLP
jgi:hypothetical protein